jgi:hypothetical protein
MIPIPEGSKCKIKSVLLCDWRTVLENNEILKESCKYCGKQVLYNKKNDRIDNAKYLSYHLRDALQPNGAMLPLYTKIYGKERIEKRKKAEEKRQSRQKGINDMPAIARESFKRLKQKTFI